MTSPVIDEDVMLEALKPVPPDQLSENTTRLRTGAALLLLDAFDRKVTRDQFLAVIGAASSLVDAVGRHEMLANVKNFEREKGIVTKADIEVALNSIVKMIEIGVDQCAKLADMLRQCPLNEDKVH